MREYWVNVYSHTLGAGWPTRRIAAEVATLKVLYRIHVIMKDKKDE